MKAALGRAGTPYLLSAPALVFLAALLVAPLVATVLLSFHSFSMYKGIQEVYQLGNYRDIFGDPYFLGVFLRTFRIAVLVTLASILIGAPEAYVLSRMREPWRSLSLLAILGPLLISVVSRTLGWALLFGSTGIVNRGLVELGLVAEPLQFMYSETGVVIALTHVLMPFMVISVWASLQRLDPALARAATSLGAGSFTVLRRIVLPQAVPGMLAGSIIVFALAASAFATPAIIGGRRLQVAATLAYDEFLNTLDWPLGAAIAVLLLVALLAIVVTSNRLVERRYARAFR